MKKIAVIILHFFQKDLTGRCLESAGQLKTRKGNISVKIKIFVVDNNPREDLTILMKKYPKSVLLKTSENLGFAGGNNFGIREALKDRPDFILIVNNDTVLERNLLINLCREAEQNPAAGILGPKIYFYPGREFHYGDYGKNERGRVIWYAGGRIDWNNVYASHCGVDELDRGQFDHGGETDFVSGCAMMVRRQVFEKIGLFDEQYFLYLEDVDLCWRAKRAGFLVVFAPSGSLWHVNAASSAVGGDLQDYYLTRNRMYFGMKFAPWRTKLALVRESLRLLVNGRRWQKIAITDFYLRRFGLGSYQRKI